MSNPSGPASCGASETTTPADAAAPATSLTVIACGNPVRGDDGVAQQVFDILRRNRPSLPPDVELIDAGTAGMEVMFRVRHARRVVIVDACRSGSEPGAIFRLPGREALTPPAHGFTLHGLRWDHALYAATKMFGEGFADRTEVFLVEAANIDFGIGLSDPVQAAAERVAVLIGETIDGDT